MDEIYLIQIQPKRCGGTVSFMAYAALGCSKGTLGRCLLMSILFDLLLPIGHEWQFILIGIGYCQKEQNCAEEKLDDHFQTEGSKLLTLERKCD